MPTAPACPALAAPPAQRLRSRWRWTGQPLNGCVQVAINKAPAARLRQRAVKGHDCRRSATAPRDGQVGSERASNGVDSTIGVRVETDATVRSRLSRPSSAPGVDTRTLRM